MYYHLSLCVETNDRDQECQSNDAKQVIGVFVFFGPSFLRRFKMTPLVLKWENMGVFIFRVCVSLKKQLQNRWRRSNRKVGQVKQLHWLQRRGIMRERNWEWRQNMCLHHDHSSCRCLSYLKWGSVSSPGRRHPAASSSAWAVKLASGWLRRYLGWLICAEQCAAVILLLTTPELLI